jgi:putative transposase
LLQSFSVIKNTTLTNLTIDLSRHHGVAENSLYRWKPKLGGIAISEAKRLRELEQENGNPQENKGAQK